MAKVDRLLYERPLAESVEVAVQWVIAASDDTEYNIPDFVDGGEWDF